MLAESAVVGFLPVTEFALAESFYSGALGLPVASRDAFALVLRASNGMTIRCVLTPGFHPQPFTVLGWEVSDLEASCDLLIAAGVRPLRYAWLEQDERAIWEAPEGSRVLWFQDPFGNTLSLSSRLVA